MTYIPHSKKDIDEMLKKIGVNSISDLFNQIPDQFKENIEMNIPERKDPFELETIISEIAEKNKLCKSGRSFLGAGLYNHYVPAIVDEISSRQEYYTAYTPYQPEISQGTLTTIFEYQTMMSRLTGLPISNASLYDGATATVEAAMLSVRETKRNTVLVSKALHPEYRNVLNTYLKPIEINVVEFDFNDSGQVNYSHLSSLLESNSSDVGAIILGSPNFFGVLEDVEFLRSKISDPKTLLIVAISEPLSMAIVKSPGELGADIVVGDSNSFGNYMNFGGPTIGFITVKENLLRNLPGRICGQTTDKDGKRAFVFTLSTREQHIRRERATSNICSNQNLLAIRATIYLSYMGEAGLSNLATICSSRAKYAWECFSKIKGIETVFNSPFFNEFVIKVNDADKYLKNLEQKGFIGGFNLEKFYPNLKNHILIAFTEFNSIKDIDEMIKEIT